MNDEQTRLLQQILEVQREQLEFAKRQRDEFMEIQKAAISGQRKGLGMTRFVIAFMVITVGLILAGTLLAP